MQHSRFYRSLLNLFFLLPIFCILGCTTNHSPNLARVNMDSSPPSLDPRMAPDRNTRMAIKSLFEGLTRINPEGEAALAAAKSFELSEDQMVYTFHLRPFQWNNGQPVTSYDFAYAWQTSLAPDFPATHAYLFYPIQGAKQAKEGTISPQAIGVETPDPKTLIVKLNHPTPFFLNLVAHAIYSPIPKEACEKDPEWFRAQGKYFVSNGPFQLTKYDPEHELLLERNPNYWDHPVTLPGIHMTFIQDPNTALAMFQQGELDWMGGPFHELPFETIPTFREEGKLCSQVHDGIYWLDFNTQSFPLTSPALRRALTLAIDRPALIQLIQQSPDTLVSNILPSVIPSQQETNLEEARAALAQALEELDLTLEELPPIHFLCSDATGQKSIAQAIQQQWLSTLGIRSEIQQLPWNNFISARVSGDYQVGGQVQDKMYDDPAFHLEKFRSPSSNFSQWSQTNFVAELDQADATTDSSERSSHLLQAAAMFAQENPVISVHYDEYRWVANPQLKGVFISRLGASDFRWAFWNEESEKR